VLPYLDVIPVPRAKPDIYKAMSPNGARIICGTADVLRDAISHHLQPGKLTLLPRAVQLREDEVVAVSLVVYKEDRDRISKAVTEDRSSRSAIAPAIRERLE